MLSRREHVIKRGRTDTKIRRRWENDLEMDMKRSPGRRRRGGIGRKLPKIMEKT